MPYNFPLPLCRPAVGCIAWLGAQIEYLGKSTPFFAQIVESGFLQLVWGHDNTKLDISSKSQKPRLGQRGNLRWVRQIDDEHRSTMTILLGEVNGFGFTRLQDSIQL